MNIKIGDKVKVVADYTGHGIKMGMILTVENIRDNGSNITVKETKQYFSPMCIKTIHTPNKHPGKFIITDPVFIMNNEQFEEIKENHQKYKEPNFEHQIFPLKSIHNQTKEPIIFHIIETTPYGRGDCEYKEIEISNDSGMLCIAENEKEWLHETYGAKFKTLQEAKDNFPIILNKF